MAVTTWVLCDEAGVPVTEIVNAAQLVFSARRNQPRQAQITLAHSDREAANLFDLLGNGVPQLRYYRDGTLRLSAYLTAIDEKLSEDEGDGDQLVAVFKDPFGRLLGDGSETGLHMPVDATYTAVDQGDIGWNLIATLNAVDDTGIREGTIDPTVDRDRTYEAGKNIGEALVQLTEVLDGPDIEFLPLDPTAEDGKLAEYTVHDSQGQVQDDLLWGYGPGTMANVRQVERKITPPINRVRLTTSDGLVSTQTDAASIARYGEWPVVRSEPNDVSVQGTLDSRAMEMLRPTWVKVLTFVPDQTLAPQPFDDFWLGDTGKFKAQDGSFVETFEPRVNGITITEGPDGDEAHELELEVQE